ncbi:hypothetical protein CD33_16110 [Ureibacillus sinduriensis BLB-1 = JCM 15800]|uniref:Uncharacterized protein n=1 Tax=Ureibacillus sinduriensis BLB-1 = JCM 15800 TaxID=1384057 RepID=A0A0A3HW85_9BACL|nr:hypothetical protein CD33_16110 [Ureibacillus sinduriensis BLB-1 = JCM 15800]
MFRRIQNERGATFALAIMMLFVVTSLVSFYCLSYVSQIKMYNSLEFANVRATINLLKEIGSK